MQSALQTAFGGLIDYAGLFPPAKLDMAQAVAEYDTARAGEHAWMLGRFIVPASRVDELTQNLGDRHPFRLSVILDADTASNSWQTDAQHWLEELATRRADTNAGKIEILEVPVPALRALRDTFDSAIGQLGMLLQGTALRDLSCFVELPRGDQWEALLPNSMAALARTKLSGKIRCGGEVPTAFPSCEELAAFVHAAHDNGVAFKATAGLHHPIRAKNETTGLLMHGFLNLLAAATFAQRGTPQHELASILAEPDPTAFRFKDDGFMWRNWTASTEDLTQMRRAGFYSYGSCSFDEPIADLTDLRIL
ncbi:MAG: hypothetical protein M3Y21_12435 [Candidatus Eremiobacteraeota bacterium]|nr:hypothetical protein [Candidatus Eremiobacteraeota bacterium]